MSEDEKLIQAARSHQGEFSLSEPWLTAGSVSSALVTESGNIYTGICLDMACGIGFCAEHSAVAAMLLNRETVIRKIVAVDSERILPPCGRCRELILQVDCRNRECLVMLPSGSVIRLIELMPHPWMECEVEEIH